MLFTDRPVRDRSDVRPLLAGVFLGVLLTWVAATQFDLGLPGRTEVRVLEGTVNGSNFDGSAIGFDGSGLVGEGFVIQGARWAGPDDVWHDSFPTCIEPLSRGQHVTLGVVDVPPTDEGPGGAIVAWVICHTEPTERFE